jgi:acyl-coenzyme A synthetase/AMP-(fatty) acid ligase
MVDKDGYFWFVGRADDVILSAAYYTIGPFEVESPCWSTPPWQEHVKQVTAPYKYPREIEFIAEQPKTISGKIRRADGRRREYDRPH